ncbi:hypothetical protein Scel_88130 [Streptomyces cellostaticus]|nr:hypothetical protein Scel_88130 [Streptomyces cellostaticus]
MTVFNREYTTEMTNSSWRSPVSLPTIAGIRTPAATRPDDPSLGTIRQPPAACRLKIAANAQPTWPMVTLRDSGAKSSKDCPQDSPGQ